MNFKTLLGIGFFLLFLIGSLHSQTLKGKVVNQDGHPLPFATLFIKPSNTGTTTNDEGQYIIPLAPGDYQVVVQYLGFETQVATVAMGSNDKQLDFTLIKRAVNLQTIDVYEGSEDPAYTVMRKAIAKADYHRQQLDTYEAKVYMKGSGKLNKAPRIFKKQLEKEGVDTSTTFTSESVSLISYKRPNTFSEEVISIYEHGEDHSTSPNRYINNSFYEPKIADGISPLSPKAFGYYRFALDDYFVDRGYTINKIKVTPRSKGENVFEGFIYIIEDDWSIYRIDLKTYRSGILFQIQQAYAPIEEQVWLPINHQFEVLGKILGFGFQFKYLASVSDYIIAINPDLGEDFALIDETIEVPDETSLSPTTNVPKNEALERLNQGEEITRKELRQIIKAYEKEERQEQEEPTVVENYSFKVDSMARSRDSTYWEEIRPIPLTKAEISGYYKMDSLARKERLEEEEEEEENGNNGNGKWSPINIITGDSYKTGEYSRFRHDNMLTKIRFNPVEGFHLYNDISWTHRHDQLVGLLVTPRYGFASDQFRIKGSFSYIPDTKKSHHRFLVNGGRYIYQYNDSEPIDPLVSMWINLIEERNYISLYEKTFAEISYQYNPDLPIKVITSVEWAQRNILENNTTQTWFNRDERIYSSNIPENIYLVDNWLENHKAFLTTIDFEVKPWQKYRIRNGKKRPINHSSPTFNLRYRTAIKDILESVANYNYLELTFKHQFQLGVRGNFDTKLQLGTFFDVDRPDQMSFVDFKHFDGNQTSLVTTDPVGSYRLLPYYERSTPEEFISAHVHYQFRKFLVSQIPEVWLLGIKENLFVNYLATPRPKDDYWEFGYSIDGILRFIRLEAAVSFDGGQYRDFGVLVGISSSLENLFD